ncbi:hypothetical protein B0H13DRAFT_1875964 [Mycena leptocephala]|nr:hypothetical protein B0H13DRAFT_1875964 [Mycena leptocephala]
MSKTLKRGPDPGVRVLSLDGGGAGALSELLILERMMYCTRVEGHLDTDPSPCECFELIGGSGTGGIIALMLGRLCMSVKDAISAYETLRPESKMGSAEKFKTRNFEEALKKIFKQGKMNDARPDASKMHVSLLEGIISSSCMIWEAARATSATPALLKTMEIGREGIKQRYIDGGIGNNNPTSLVLREANRLYPLQRIILVASIGAGHPDTIQIPKPRCFRLNTIANVMKNIATDCEKTHEDLNAGRFRDIPNTYFRFNVQQGMQAIEPKHWHKISEVQAHTDSYLRTEDTKLKLTTAVKVILNPALPVSESPVYWRVCPPPTFRFTGRQEFLQEMREYFNTAIGRRHVFLLHGLGGAGKSQIAFKFVEMSAFPEPRSTRQTIDNDLVTLALTKQIGKTAKDSLLWLSHQRQEWLLVFNNADDIRLNLQEFFPSGSHGNILITSRNPALGQHSQAERKVDRMELGDEIELLLAAAACDPAVLEYRELAKRIVQNFGLIIWFKKLHCFPLAIAQAGASISSLHALHQYLELYQNTAKRIQQLNRRPVQSEYEWSVYTTWQISFEKLSSPAAKLLQLCSFIHHDGISEKIFQQAILYKPIPTDDLHEAQEFLTSFLEDTSSNWDLQKFLDITAELRQYSLIEVGSPSRDFTFSIHPLVHEWCRTTVKLDAPTELCMHKLMGMSLSSANNDFWWNHHLFPHLHVLLFPKTGEGLELQLNVLDMTFPQEFLWVYSDEGKWSEGEQLARSMLEIGSERGIQESKILNIQRALGVMYSGLGRFNDAKKIEELVLTRRIELFGDAHSNTLSAMANLAVTYSQLGQFKRAEELETTVLNKRRHILGEDHPDTLRAMANLAVTYSELGQCRQAEGLETTVLDKFREILGEHHPDTLSTMGNLANRYSELGQFRRAEELYKTVLTKRREILGEDHSHTINAMGNLAETYYDQGRWNEAEHLQVPILAKMRCGRDYDEQDTLTAMAQLAKTYSRKGFFEQAEVLQRASSEQLERRLYPNHPKVLEIKMDLATTFRDQGCLEEAENLGMEVAQRIAESESLGKDHPTTFRAQAVLATIYRRRGRFQDAETLGKEVLEKQSTTLGEEHPESLRSQASLGLTLYEMGRLSEARELQDQALQGRRRVLGPSHPVTQENARELEETIRKVERSGE